MALYLPLFLNSPSFFPILTLKLQATILFKKLVVKSKIAITIKTLWGTDIGQLVNNSICPYLRY